jgi:Sigma 54 modulation protein / S30EA ribosomal protein
VKYRHYILKLRGAPGREFPAIAALRVAQALPHRSTRCAYDIMETTQHPFPVQVRTGWIDFSPALHWYAAQKVRSALRPVASRVRSVTVRVADHEPHDPATRLCAVDVSLRPTGTVSATSTGGNVSELVDRAAEAIVEKLRRQHEADLVHEPLSTIA